MKGYGNIDSTGVSMPAVGEARMVFFDAKFAVYLPNFTTIVLALEIAPISECIIAAA